MLPILLLNSGHFMLAVSLEATPSLGFLCHSPFQAPVSFCPNLASCTASGSVSPHPGHTHPTQFPALNVPSFDVIP